MMYWFWLGVLAFFITASSDGAQLLGHARLRSALFALGSLLLCLATAGMLARCCIADRFAAAPLQSTFAAALCFFWIGLLGYTLFFALPAADAYAAQHPVLVDRGVYALCRHPGVWWLSLFYLSLWLLSAHAVPGVAFFCYTLLDIAYVAWQDAVVFPKTIPGYSQYQLHTPFLVPTRRSIAACFSHPT